MASGAETGFELEHRDDTIMVTFVGTSFSVLYRKPTTAPLQCLPASRRMPMPHRGRSAHSYLWPRTSQWRRPGRLAGSSSGDIGQKADIPTGARMSAKCQ
jgi:hypothetical protein